jgi:hypothetical protein
MANLSLDIRPTGPARYAAKRPHPHPARHGRKPSEPVGEAADVGGHGIQEGRRHSEPEAPLGGGVEHQADVVVIDTAFAHCMRPAEAGGLASLQSNPANQVPERLKGSVELSLKHDGARVR